jgi:hypothetical protein
MKTVLLRKIRQRYDYFWHITPGTNWASEEVRLRVFNKKTKDSNVVYSAKDLISNYIANTNMNIITRTIWNNTINKHTNKLSIREWNKQKKNLAELSTNLTIKQVINPKNVKSFKMKEQKINLSSGTSNSISTTLGPSSYTVNGAINTHITNSFVHNASIPFFNSTSYKTQP